MSNLKKVAIEAALKAGAYQMKRKGHIKEISYKGAINIVTDVDKKSEKMIISHIKKNFKGHGFIAEESEPVLNDADYIWIIDPLDGTTNYSQELPVYCVSIGLQYKGEVILGVVYAPELNELFYAQKGKGAFLNNKRIKVSDEKKLNKSFLATGFAYDVRKTKLDNIDNFECFVKKSLAVRRLGSAAIDMCYVGCGRFDGYWERNLQPWDAAAGLLIINEAGGNVSLYNGKKYLLGSKEILCSNGKIHNAMGRILTKNAKKTGVVKKMNYIME